LSRELLTWVLRQQLKYDGLLAADAFTMRGLLDAVADEGDGAVRAVAAGCDVLLAPRDVAATAAALDRARATGVLDPARAQTAERRRLKWAQWAAPPNDWRRPSASDAQWGAQLADRAVHVAQGTPPTLGARVPLLALDDDVAADGHAPGGAPARRRAALVDALHAGGYRDGAARPLARRGGRGGAREHRHAARRRRVRRGARRARARGLRGGHVRGGAAGRRGGATARRRRPRAPVRRPTAGAAARRVELPVVSAWSGDRAMQQAAARWLLARRGR
jgi:beta-glucosidase-like glycosyl hydrolase